MGRPPLPIGAHGNITFREINRADGSKAVEARCWFRGGDGALRRLKRVRPSKAKAEAALRAAVVELAEEIRGGDIGKDTRLRVVAEQWFATVALEVDEGAKSPETLRNYRGYLDNHILPALAELRGREFTTPRVEAFLTAKRAAGAKPGSVRGMKAVLTNLAAYGVRLGWVDANPVRETSKVKVSKPAVVFLTVEQRTDLLAKLEADELAVQQDLPDIARGLLATGVRLSELLGCAGADYFRDDRRRPVLRAEHRTTQVKGQGVVRRPRTGGTKGNVQVLGVPDWSVSMFTRRALAAAPDGPLFGDSFSRWRAPGNVGGKLHAALDRIGYEWVTSHVLGRKTVANALTAAGHTPDEVAAQLGHTTSRTTRERYLAPAANNDGQLATLERMFESGP
jgi:integrase